MQREREQQWSLPVAVRAADIKMKNVFGVRESERKREKRVTVCGACFFELSNTDRLNAKEGLYAGKWCMYWYSAALPYAHVSLSHDDTSASTSFYRVGSSPFGTLCFLAILSELLFFFFQFPCYLSGF